MCFKKWIFNEPLYVNKFGILEPNNSKKEIVPDLVMVPLVAFDLHGYRLGFGSGYYDKTLSVFRAKKKIVAIGLAREFQKVELIPGSPNDQ